MFPSYFDYIFMHRRQKARLRPELSPKFLSTVGPKPNSTRKARLDLQLCPPYTFHTYKLEHFIRSLCEDNKIGFLQVTTQLKQTSLASLETDRSIHNNEQRRINDLVEIVVAEVTGLQLYRLKI